MSGHVPVNMFVCLGNISAVWGWGLGGGDDGRGLLDMTGRIQKLSENGGRWESKKLKLFMKRSMAEKRRADVLFQGGKKMRDNSPAQMTRWHRARVRLPLPSPLTATGDDDCIPGTSSLPTAPLSLVTSHEIEARERWQVG